MPKTASPPKPARIRPPRSATANVRPQTGAGAALADQDAQHRRMLIGVAYHSGSGDPDCCLAPLAVLSASRALRRALDRDLGPPEMSDCSFVALVTLYALEPVACTPEALAHDAEIEPDAMLKVLDFLEQRGWVSREYPGPRGRSSRVHLTDTGIEITVLAVHRFLEISAALAGEVGADERSAAIKACTQLVRAAGWPLNSLPPAGRPT